MTIDDSMSGVNAGLPARSTPFALRSNARMSRYCSTVGFGPLGGMFGRTKSATSLAVWNWFLRYFAVGRGSSGSAFGPTTGGAWSVPWPASPWHFAQNWP